MQEDLILLEEMKQLGLSQYEAQAYLRLLEKYPVNGYMLSKRSGIPRSRIYEVLDNLSKKQLVFEHKEENGMVYVPLEPELLMQKLKQDYKAIFSHVQKETYTLYAKSDTTYESKTIRGRKNIFSFLNLLIDHAKERIDVSIWEEETNDLQEKFMAAEARGVEIKGIYFGRNNPFRDVTTHRRIETYLKEKNERYLIIVIDNKEAITGIVSRGEDSQITWTNDLGLIEISEDYIVHDLIVNIYSASLDESARAAYEAATDRVRAGFYHIR